MSWEITVIFILAAMAAVVWCGVFVQASIFFYRRNKRKD
jgi:hypothetical protein